MELKMIEHALKMARKEPRYISVELSTTFARFGRTRVSSLEVAKEMAKNHIDYYNGSQPHAWIYIYKDDPCYKGGVICEMSALITENGVKEFNF